MKFITERFDRRQLENKRLEISRLCNIPSGSILMYENGRFEIYDIQESMYQLIISKLRSNSSIYNITTNQRNDFGHFNFKTNRPKQKYIITGFIKE